MHGLILAMLCSCWYDNFKCKSGPSINYASMYAYFPNIRSWLYDVMSWKRFPYPRFREIHWWIWFFVVKGLNQLLLIKYPSWRWFETPWRSCYVKLMVRIDIFSASEIIYSEMFLPIKYTAHLSKYYSMWFTDILNCHGARPCYLSFERGVMERTKWYDNSQLSHGLEPLLLTWITFNPSMDK